VSDRLSIRFTARAARQVEQAGRWWRDNRPKAPGAVREELDRALELLAVQPHVGAKAGSVALGSVRRVLLSRINYHLYYRIRGTPPDGIEVLAFWHGSRGAPP
jgi:plasmid stabilization system protein ParE